MPPKVKKQPVEDTRKRKRAGGKAAKDKNEPKRPITAFFFFAQDMRTKVKEENPEFKVTEISKELGKRWKELNEKQKEKYTKQAISDKQRYEKEKRAYDAAKGSKQDDDDDEEEEEED